MRIACYNERAVLVPALHPMKNFRPNHHVLASSLRVIAVIAFVSLCSGLALAQSGRRAQKSSLPAPTPTPQATPSEKKPVAETEAGLSFVVGIDRVANFASIPMYFYDSVLRACAERLEDASSVKVNVENREMNRVEAIKRAKAETESHIVWLQLRYQTGSGGSEEDLREVYIDYWVFAPTTAKMVNGRSYQRVYRGGGVIMTPNPGGRVSLPYIEQLLKQAARDAADKILSALELPGRSVPGY
jgi:hypothetical protein